MSTSPNRLAARKVLLAETLNDITRKVEADRLANLASTIDEKAEKVNVIVAKFVDKGNRNELVRQLGVILGLSLLLPEPVRNVAGSVVVCGSSVTANGTAHTYPLNQPILVRSVDEQKMAHGIFYDIDGSVQTPNGFLPGIRTNGLDVVRHATHEEIATLVGRISDDEVSSMLNSFEG